MNNKEDMSFVVDWITYWGQHEEIQGDTKHYSTFKAGWLAGNRTPTCKGCEYHHTMKLTHDACLGCNRFHIDRFKEKE